MIDSFYAPETIVRGHYVLPLSICLSVRPSHLKSLCNRLLLEFSSNQFETLHRYYQITEDVHATLHTKNKFGQNYGVFDLDNFEVSLQYGTASLCNQLLEFSSHQFESLHRCYQPIEDVHVAF